MEIINGEIIQTTKTNLQEYIDGKKKELAFHQEQLKQIQYQIDKILAELLEITQQ